MPAGSPLGTEFEGPQNLFEKVEALAGKAEESHRAQELLDAQLGEEADLIVDMALSHAGQMRRLWQSYCAEGMAGRTGEVHARREDFLRQFQARARLVARARTIAESVFRLTGRQPVGAGALPEAAADLERLEASIFTRWKTQEDLEDLLAEMYPLPNSRLEELGQKYQAPTAWYEQEGKPF